MFNVRIGLYHSEKGKKLTRCRGFYKSKRGIHPVSTVILLFVILLVIVGIIYLWMTMKERAGHAIQIQSVTFEESRTRIYVQNVGKGTVIIESVHINDEKIDIHSTNYKEDSEKTTEIKERQTVELIINRAYKEKVHIRVVCKDGTFIEAEWGP